MKSKNIEELVIEQWYQTSPKKGHFVISCFESYCGCNPGSAAVNGSFGIDFNRPVFHPVFLG